MASRWEPLRPTARNLALAHPGHTCWSHTPATVHFYTFGCINCIRNLPHYNDWHERFDTGDFAVIGIHRPETDGERDIEEVRRKAAEAGLKYPIAVDNEGCNWDAWANRVWLSVYVIDQNGFV